MSELSLVVDGYSQWPDITWNLPAGCQTEVDLDLIPADSTQYAVKSLPRLSKIKQKQIVVENNHADAFITFLSSISNVNTSIQHQIEELNISLSQKLLHKLSTCVNGSESMQYLSK